MRPFLNPNVQVRVADDLPREAAQYIAEVLNAVIMERGKATIALSGGSTPRPVFEILAQEYADSVEWAKVLFFWSDERFVPPDSAESNQPMARELLLDPLQVTAAQVFAFPTVDTTPEQAAIEYAGTLQHVLGDSPQFDLILLGMGDDGHTASLFPDTAALHAESNHDRAALVVANTVPQVKNSERLTFTFSLINAARIVLFMVSGAGKADILEKVLITEPDRYPTQRVTHPIFYLDRAAAAKLDTDTTN